MQVRAELPERARACLHRGRLRWVVCGALFLKGIDIAMLNLVAVPAIAADLGLRSSGALGG